MSDNKPKIYVFSGGGSPGFKCCYALAEDGEVLGTHICSSEDYAPGDLGVTPGRRADRHEDYAKHYPGGYEMEFVRECDIDSHAGLTEALRRLIEAGDKKEKQGR